MKRSANHQVRFEFAFSAYLGLTSVLREDLAAMLAEESKAAHWRRNFVRASAALLEGHAESLTRMCIIAIELDAACLTAKERKAVLEPDSVGTSERLKLILRAAYKLFDLQPMPRFDTNHWKEAQRFMRKRHRLMHPTHPRDLGIADTTWRRLRKGIIWFMQQFFDFLSLAQVRYGT